MKIRDRIKSLRRVKASELLPHPKNWRAHPQEQQDAMRGVLAEIGYADALLVRKTPDGLQILDGHLRAEITPDEKVPVLVVDLNDEEADKLLATHDPLGAMAEANRDALGKLLAQIETESDAVKTLLEGLAAENEIDLFEGAAEDGADGASEDIIPEKWGVYIECEGEDQQRKLLERLTEEGLDCRGLTT